MNHLKKLESLGQSVWLDYLSRKLIRSGELDRMIRDDGISGITSNPSIFEKAIGQSDEYDDQIRELAGSGMRDPRAVFRGLAVRDIQDAADRLASVYRATNGADGYISHEVSPDLADDTEGTIREARESWSLIGRPNVMIKVPATDAGLPAICRLTADGLNINITLLFSRDVYRKVADAFIEGLGQRKGDLGRIASVASFFVSRIDTRVDNAIGEKLKSVSGERRATLENLRGKIAIANAKLAYEMYKEIFSGPRWAPLKARGARPQRLLWASTSTKNRAYSDVLYVEALIGRDTVNTLPPETLEAYLDHGSPEPRIEQDLAAARADLAALGESGISLDRATDELTREGVDAFAASANRLHAALRAKMAAFSGEPQKHASAGS